MFPQNFDERESPVTIATAWNAKNQFPTHLVVISHYYTFQNQFSKWPNIFRFAWFEK